MGSYKNISELFKKIIELLEEGQKRGELYGVIDLMAKLQVSRPTLDKCMILLEWEGIVNVVVAGKKKIFILMNKNKLEDFLKKFEEKKMEKWFMAKSE